MGEHRRVTWDGVGRSYDQVARSYEARFRDELAGKPRDRQLLEAFAASVGDPVVEVGCGPGQVGGYLRERGRSVIGADISPAMAELALFRLDAALVADMRSLPLRTGAVAGLVAFYSLIHVRRSEVPAVLREFERVLWPGGLVLLSAHEGQGEIQLDEFLGHAVPFAATLFELEELVRATEAAGLQVVRAERRAPYPSESPTFRLYIEAEHSL
jgi:SAM-dependent methyltransferase